jgi:outer membrane protein OmpA-like peptidoglycan-associated protein
VINTSWHQHHSQLTLGLVGTWADSETARQPDHPAQRLYAKGIQTMFGENPMRLMTIKPVRLLCLPALALLAVSFAHASTPTKKFEAGKKAKVTGSIVSRNGDLVTVKVKKENTSAIVNITDNTKIEREKSFRLRKEDMDVTAMVPGLTISAEGVGNSNGQLDAGKITFNPDTFAVEVSEEQQIEANKAAAANAQTTANQGVAAAGQAQASANKAQSSANQAQSSANQAQSTAMAAGTGAVMDAEAISLVNKRVSDLGDYNTVVEAALFFDPDQASLSADDKKALDKLAADAMSTQNYMIEIAGYASSTGTKAQNQKLSDERATAVAQYLRNSASVPMRRILAPAGYGAAHAAAPNSDPEGRDINRRVDVKVLVNKGLNEAI